jgi:phasin protein
MPIRNRSPCHACEYMTMAKDKEPLQSLTGFVEQTAEQITKQTQDYFGWLQETMSTFPWSNTNLNRILVSHATQNVTATFAFVQKLSQAKNFQDVVKIQTEFMNAQLSSFNDQARIVGEIYTKAATAAAKTPFNR